MEYTWILRGNGVEFQNHTQTFLSMQMDILAKNALLCDVFQERALDQEQHSATRVWAQKPKTPADCSQLGSSGLNAQWDNFSRNKSKPSELFALRKRRGNSRPSKS